MIQSLRLRLVCVTVAAVVIVSVTAAILAPFDSYNTTQLPLSSLMQEPYQDLLMLVPLGLLAIALTWTVSGWSLRPLRQASQSAAAIGPDNLTARIEAVGIPSEILPLVEAFNSTLDRLSDAYQSERRFLSDAAHELRTPLAVLSLRVQRARDGAIDLEAIERDVVGMSRLTTQLLDLARKDHLARAGAVIERQPVDLARLTREAAASAFPLAEAAKRDILVEAPDALVVSGQPDDLRDLMRNLIDNALLHGRGTVVLRCEKENRAGDGRAIVSVEDEGEGVPPGMEELVFERFRKGDPISAGHGLGLAIVRETVRSLGGRVGIRPGPGCVVRVELPLRDSDLDGSIRRILVREVPVSERSFDGQCERDVVEKVRVREIRSVSPTAAMEPLPSHILALCHSQSAMPRPTSETDPARIPIRRAIGTKIDHL